VVPDVVGMPEVRATSVLQQAGFTVIIVNAPEPNGQARGTVFKQSPPAGSTEAQGTSITIYV